MARRDVDVEEASDTAAMPGQEPAALREALVTPDPR
jgi:hypothetical protein